MPRIRRWFLLLVTVWMTALPAALAQDAPEPTHVLLPADTALLQEVYARINSARSRRGLPPYRWNAALTIAAQNQAEWLVGTHSRAHFRPDGSSPHERAMAAGFPPVGWCCGENFYMSIDATPELVVHWWIGSVNHSPNIFHRQFTDIGVGMATDGYRTAYVTVFGRIADPNRADYPEPTPTAESVISTVVPELATTPVQPTDLPEAASLAADAAPADVVITVASGDTLAGIAARYGVSLEALAAANNLQNLNLIYPGQELRLPP